MFQTSLFDDLDQEEIEETVRKDLIRGSGFVNGKVRIQEMFHQKISKSDRITQLKKEYGTGGRGNSEYFQKHDDSGISIKINNGSQRLYTWGQVHDLIDALIQAGEY